MELEIFSLYKDFFNFLDRIKNKEVKWKSYLINYYEPHREFLDSYLKHFPFLDASTLRQRVEATKPEDYSWLRHLLSFSPPEEIIRAAYKKCSMAVAPEIVPQVFLFIGYFSPEGFVMEFRGKPVICFGLERFKDFRLLKILFAHEYAHFLLNSREGEILEEKKLKWLLLCEGFCAYFSSLVFQDSQLSEHLLFPRDVLNWSQENLPLLREVYLSHKYSDEEIFEIYFKGKHELGIPPRTGRYLGFQAVKRFLSRKDDPKIGELIKDKALLLSIKI